MRYIQQCHGSCLGLSLEVHFWFLNILIQSSASKCRYWRIQNVGPAAYAVSSENEMFGDSPKWVFHPQSKKFALQQILSTWQHQREDSFSCFSFFLLLCVHAQLGQALVCQDNPAETPDWPVLKITKRQEALVHGSWWMMKPIEVNSKRMMDWMWPDMKRRILQKT